MKNILVMILGCWGMATFAVANDTNFVYDDHGKRDPFWKLVSPSGAIVTYETDLLLTDMTLEGIIFDPNGNSLAIINGVVVERKGRFGLYTIEKIETDKVILQKGLENFTLELKKEE